MRNLEQFVEEVTNALALRHNRHSSQLAHLVPRIRQAYEKEGQIESSVLTELFRYILPEDPTIYSVGGKKMLEKARAEQLQYPQLTGIALYAFDEDDGE